MQRLPDAERVADPAALSRHCSLPAHRSHTLKSLQHPWQCVALLPRLFQHVFMRSSCGPTQVMLASGTWQLCLPCSSWTWQVNTTIRNRCNNVLTARYYYSDYLNYLSAGTFNSLPAECHMAQLTALDMSEPSAIVEVLSVA